MKKRHLLLLAIAGTLLNCLVGCAHQPIPSTQPITAQTASHIVATGGYLSEIDGKAASIKALLK